MDPWWNPSIEEQAVDRIYRIGQSRPVSIFKILIENTIEDRVIDLQKKKRKLVFHAFGRQQQLDIESLESLEDLQVLLGDNK